MTILQELIVPLSLDTSKFTSGINSAIKESDSLTSGLSKIGGGIVLGGLGLAAGAITAVTGATIKGVDSALDWGNTLDSISDILGTTSEESAGLALMVKRVGGSTEQLTSSMKLMTKGLIDANGQLGPAGEALAKLGINALDAQGNIRPATDIFQDVANVLGNMPDGLEKSSLMMDIFGKSGAEMGDILGAAANGGLNSFNQEAKDLGLAFSGEQTQNIIEFQKQQEKLNQTFQGLSVSLGLAVLPALSKVGDTISQVLARPDVQAGIQTFVKFIGDLATSAANYLPIVIQNFKLFADWLSNNQGVIVGVLGALGVAVIAFGVSVATAAWTALAPLLPVIAVMALVGLAAYALYEAWTNNFGGIQDKVKAVWDFLKPVFERIKEWFETNIPIAINKLKEFWENVLLPAMTKVYKWMEQNLFPLFKSIGEFLSTAFSLYITALAGLWENVLWPAIKKVVDWIKENVMPILKPIGEFIGGALKAAFKGLSDIIAVVTASIDAMTRALQKIKLPSWLTPGSPTPFENGLVGINKAMSDLNKTALPKFQASLNISSSPINQPATVNNGFNEERLARLIVSALQQGG